MFVAWLAELAVGLHRPVSLGPLLAGVMAAVPAVLWLAFFYGLDTAPESPGALAGRKREPKQLVAGVAVLGMLVAAPLANFVQYQAVPPVALAVHGLSAASIDRIVYAVAVAGVAQEVCKYAVVRYSIYLSDEFDHPMDGIIYMMACGTGVAIWVNYHRLSGQGHQVFLSTGAAQAVVTTLAHGSFAGVLGYVMGRAKFSKRTGIVRGVLLMIGLLSAAALNGQFTLVENWIVQSGVAQHPWRGVGYAAACAATVFLAIWFAARRLVAGRESEPQPVVAAEPTDVSPVTTMAAVAAPAAEPSDVQAGDKDPMEVAAAALARIRRRAREDLSQLRRSYQRHDGIVLVLALGLVVVAGRVHARLVTPPTQVFESHGLTFAHSTAWLAPEAVALAPSRLVSEQPSAPATAADPGLYRVEFTSTIDPSAKIEIRIDKAPAWSNVVMALELDRRLRWGELYMLDDSELSTIDGHEWLRTRYRYAHNDGVPRIDRAIEYATTDREQVYVLTLFGTADELAAMENVTAPSLRVRSQTGKPMVSQATYRRRVAYPGPIGRAFDSTVMVIVADVSQGRITPRGGGSGVIVGADGSVLTNAHLMRDKDDRFHDWFVIARYSAIDPTPHSLDGNAAHPGRAPQIECVGHPNRSKVLPTVDLALIKCDTDLDGRAWSPSFASSWPPVEQAHSRDLPIGERLWVLGFPETGGGGLRIDNGVVQGFTGPNGAVGRDYIQTDASVSSGSSGGPVVSDRGELIGIASAYRASGRVGLVRPLRAASQLLAYAAAGWTPLENHTEVELALPVPVATAAGIRISTTVVDEATAAPIADALVMLLRPEVSAAATDLPPHSLSGSAARPGAAGAIDLNRLDVQAVAWGKTNSNGDVRLRQAVPVGIYTVIVTAPGYEILIGDRSVHIDDKTPTDFDPWRKIELRAR